jgi:ABC-type transport system involved in cytochrome bd biosynthesis fused ATPase/permease subunit
MDMMSAYKVARLKLQKALSRPTIALAQQGDIKLNGPISVAAKAVKLGPVQDLYFSLPAGHWGTLQGANGSGKSLLLSAIAGLEDPEQGEIYLSGQSLRTVSRGTLRRKIALISPDCTILRGSLRRVLCLYLLDRPSDRKLQRAVNNAGLSILSERCGGLDGKIKEGARSLSNGERVRISIAQAILANPGLILVENVWPLLDRDGHEKLLDWLKRTEATVLSVGSPDALTVALEAEKLAVTCFKS